jgi:hypothetical protein
MPTETESQTSAFFFLKQIEKRGQIVVFPRYPKRVLVTANRALSLETRKRSPPGGMTVLGHS